MKAPRPIPLKIIKSLIPTKASVKKFWSDTLPAKNIFIGKTTPFKNLVALTFLINFIAVVSVIILQKYLPPEIPLFYGLPEGGEQLGTSWLLILPSLVSLFIISINLYILKYLEDEFFKKVLVAVGFVSTIFSLTTTIKIIFLVGGF